MTMTATDDTLRTLDFNKEQRIDAPIEIVFQTLLDEIGPGNEGPPGQPMPMKLEAWPGGRWYRDLGNNTGHFWGHVQVIKPPTILEICGPMFMSYPAAGHIAWRLKADGNSTVLSLRHRAFGMIPEEHITGVRSGWSAYLERIAKAALKR
jgi:uncharacterized protein YndB with AHSA1/START domain